MSSSRAKRMRRSRLRIGFVCGKEDGDLVVAPSIPAKYWVSSAYLDDAVEPYFPLREHVHTDVAIWWHVRQYYSSIVDADLISAPDDVDADRLESNDFNLLLGWDAVSAHMEEVDDGRRREKGHSAKMRELLRDPKSKVWPSGSLQDLCNDKGTYLKFVADSGIVPVAPTEVFECREGDQASSSEAFAHWATTVAKERGWSKFIAKPSPSSWSRGVETFEVESEKNENSKSVAWTRKLLRDYYEENKGAKHIVLQPHLVGLEKEPETRCFFFGDTYLYAVANFSAAGAAEKDGREDDDRVTHHPEAASSTSLAERILPKRYWHRHKDLGQKLISECLLPKLAEDEAVSVPGVIRLDFGLHSARDLLNADDQEGDVVFLNEIEIVPTLYLDTKFQHDRDFVSEYAARFVQAAVHATGTYLPELDDLVANAKRREAD